MSRIYFNSKLYEQDCLLFILWGNYTKPICGLGENHFAYLQFEKYHLTHLWYVSINLRNPPQAQPLQKHLLIPKHNITRIKTPNTQKLFERETCGEINMFFVVWSVQRGRKHKFHNIEAGEGSFSKENQGICVCSRFRVSDFVQVSTYCMKL